MAKDDYREAEFCVVCVLYTHIIKKVNGKCKGEMGFFKRAKRNEGKK